MKNYRLALRRRVGLLCVIGLAVALSGCAGLLSSANDSACARDLKNVEHMAQAARGELADGVPAENRQATLARMVDAAGRARATCGYETPDTKGSRRARQPKAG